MTSGVSRSLSLPCSAMAGEAKASVIKAMQTLRTNPDGAGSRANSCEKCVVNGYRVGVTCAVN